MLDGDGMILKFSFGGDAAGDAEPACRVRGRFVRTHWYEEEAASGEVRYRNTFGTQSRGFGGGRGLLGSSALDLELKNVANTNAQWWGGRLLALWEARRSLSRGRRVVSCRVSRKEPARL